MDIKTAFGILRTGNLDNPHTGSRDHVSRTIAILETETAAMVEALRNIAATLRDNVTLSRADCSLLEYDVRAILSRIDGAGDTLPDMPAPAPTGEERARPRTQWALTIIRKNWEPRFSVYPTEEDVRLDLLEYAREVLDLEVSDLADIAELADRVGEDGRDQVYCGPAGPC